MPKVGPDSFSGDGEYGDLCAAGKLNGLQTAAGIEQIPHKFLGFKKMNGKANGFEAVAGSKGKAFYRACAFGNMNKPQRPALGKGSATDFYHAVGERQGFQACAFFKGAEFNNGNAAGKTNRRKAGAVLEGVAANAYDAIGQRHGPETGTGEGAGADGHDSVGEVYGPQGRTVHKGTVADGSEAMWKRYLCQSAAAVKGVVSNRLYAFGKHDGGELAAVAKGLITDLPDAVGDRQSTLERRVRLARVAGTQLATDDFPKNLLIPFHKELLLSNSEVEKGTAGKCCGAAPDDLLP